MTLGKDGPFSRSSSMEWRAWHRIVLALDKLGVDMDTADELTSAIKDWGEWRTQQHRDQDFQYHVAPYFDENAVGAAMEERRERRGK